MTIAPPFGMFTTGNMAAIAIFGARDQRQLTTLGLVECSPVHQPDGSLSSGRAAAMIEAALRDSSTYDQWTFQASLRRGVAGVLMLTRIEIHGQPVLQATIRDETQTKKLQASISQQDRLASMGLLAAGVAHEINNPLASVLFNLETLAEELPKLAAAMDPPMLNDLVERAREGLVGAQRIKTISKAIGTFARVEGTERSRVDVNHALQCAATMALNDIRFRARLVLDLGDLPAVWASEGKLSQVFLNLLINAAQAFGDAAIEKNRIRIRTWTEGDKVWAEWRIRAPGIPAEKLGGIFEPLLHDEAGRDGLGARSFNLPRYRDRVRRRHLRRQRAGQGHPLSREPPGATRRVAAFDTGVSDRLGPAAERPHADRRRQAGDPIAHRAHAREEAPKSSPRNRRKPLEPSWTKDDGFDVILCDLMMPGMTGMELHEWLLANDLELAQRVIFLTGGAFTPKAAEYIEHVPNRTLEKPFGSAQLDEALSAVMKA